MNTFKRAEFRIAYKIFCLIIDWNGSDKLGFINERVHSPLAALPGNSENLREARGWAIIGGGLLQLHTPSDGVQHVFSLRAFSRTQVCRVTLWNRAWGDSGTWGVPFLVFSLALWNRLSVLLGYTGLWAWKWRVDRGLATPQGRRYVGNTLGSLPHRGRLRTMLTPLLWPIWRGWQNPREVWDSWGLDRDHWCLDGDGTSSNGPSTDRRLGGRGPSDGCHPWCDHSGSEGGGKASSWGWTLCLEHPPVRLADVTIPWDGGGLVKLLLICLLVAAHREVVIIWNWGEDWLARSGSRVIALFPGHGGRTGTSSGRGHMASPSPAQMLTYSASVPIPYRSPLLCSLMYPGYPQQDCETGEGPKTAGWWQSCHQPLREECRGWKEIHRPILWSRIRHRKTDHHPDN